MMLEELETIWGTLQPPRTADGINGKRAAGLPADQPIYLAIDSSRRRHLLIQVPDIMEPINQRDTRSLEVSTSRFQVGSNPEALFVDLICTDSTQNATFLSVTQDLLRSIHPSTGPIRDSIISALSRWRAFWAAKTTIMSREAALGLFGELWFMRRWIGTINSTIIEHWQATESARHDFQWSTVSVEVKTAETQTTSAPVHHIVSLDQLDDPETGQLFLFSLQLIEDAMAKNTLQGLIDTLTEYLKDDFQALNAFREKLIGRGYSPSDCQVSTRPLRILAERLYHIDSAFPRLLRTTFGPNGVPNGVIGVSYKLDLTACEKWLFATHPQEAQSILTE